MAKKSAPRPAPDNVLVKLLARTLVVGFLAAACTAVFSLTLSNTYQAVATVLLAPLPISAPEANEQVNPATQVGFLMSKPLAVLDYELLLTNDEIVEELRDLVVRKRDELELPEAEIKFEDVRSMMKIQTRILKQTVYDVVYQPVIELKFESESPEIAADAVNEWSRLAIELSSELAKKSQEGLEEFLALRLNEKTAELETVDQGIEELDAEMVIEDWRMRLNQLEGMATSLQMDRSTLATQIAETRGQVTELETQLAKVPQKITVRRALPEEAYWLLEAQEKPTDTSKVFESEEINQSYLQIQNAASQAQSALQGSLDKLAETETQLAVLLPEIDALRERIATHERLRAAAVRKQAALSQQYEQLVLNYGAAQIAKAKVAPDLKLVSKASVPEEKTGPHRSLFVMAAFILGLLIVPVHFFVLSMLRMYSDRFSQIMAPSQKSTEVNEAK
ncbi:MAG: hypothetical protein KJ052_03640 [Candidatus Hydrogenedentes bacterium]|nr:hypothetical protein [Candidatus Hydrogenedentota bacterium]